MKNRKEGKSFRFLLFVYHLNDFFRKKDLQDKGINGYVCSAEMQVCINVKNSSTNICRHIY